MEQEARPEQGAEKCQGLEVGHLVLQPVKEGNSQQGALSPGKPAGVSTLPFTAEQGRDLRENMTCLRSLREYV